MYVADDNQGNVGVVEFQPDGAIAAMSARAPGRVLDRMQAIGLAPPGLRDSLARISELALLQEGLGVSQIFWTAGDFVQGPESWNDMWQRGVELFDREFLSDSEWEEVGVPFYDLTEGVARVVVAVSARAMVRVPMLRLTEDEFRLLIPKNSKHESVAVDLLLREGLFEIDSGA